ncbi:MAG TPA: acyltransferase, partial [Gemmatimonadota bacterium]|nr:acyltransferase [Gemmatimonadota bacterium]
VDMAARGFGIVLAGWLNFVFVWLAIHQLGFAWRDGALSEPRRAVSFALAGLAGLIVLVGTAGYPVSMVTVPGPVAANATPPTLALLALGVTHTGIVVSLEAPARRLLERSALWTATVLVNGITMTVYLWHATVMVVLVGVAELPGGVGLHFVPNTPTWWYSRVPWILVLFVGLSLFVAVFGVVELQPRPPAAAPRAWRSVAGALAVCVGLVALAQAGIGADNAVGFRLVPVLVTLAGAVLVAATRIPGLGSRGPAARASSPPR